jgi:hypothetical protein
MAEVPAIIEANTVRLQVAAARQEESGHGIARLPKSAMARLGITEGDILEIVGKRSTPARAVLPYPEDEGLEVIRLDGLQRGKARPRRSSAISSGGRWWRAMSWRRPVSSKSRTCRRKSRGCSMRRPMR